MYNKNNRLKKRKSFNYIHIHGKSIFTDLLILKVVDTKSNCYKVGFSVSKKIGNAVQRNLTKRHMKECFRNLNLPIPNDCYFIILAKPAIVNAQFSQIQNNMYQLISKLLAMKNIVLA